MTFAYSFSAPTATIGPPGPPLGDDDEELPQAAIVSPETTAASTREART